MVEVAVSNLRGRTCEINLRAEGRVVSLDDVTSDYRLDEIKHV